MRRYEILIGFFLGTALWATVMALQSDASALHQICETNQYTGRENCTAHHFLYVAFYYIGYAVNPITVGAAATVAIAVFTYTLYEATIGLVRAAEIQSADMKRSIITSEIAANAADLSARAAVAIQLPIIRIVPDGFGYGFSQNGSGPRIEYCALGSLGLMNTVAPRHFRSRLGVGGPSKNCQMFLFTLSQNRSPST